MFWVYEKLNSLLNLKAIFARWLGNGEHVVSFEYKN
jgi:hypothetical protein